MHLHHHEPDAGSILATLSGVIRDFKEPIEKYLQHTGEFEMINPFQSVLSRINLPEPTHFPASLPEQMGIRHLVFNGYHHPLSESHAGIAEDLRLFFSTCTIVEFDNWADKDFNATCWEGLYKDVFKASGRHDYHFIFHLGDTRTKQVFDIDEILDIISDYCFCGRVTLVVDDYEADSLWSRLNHGNSIAGGAVLHPEERYRLLFNTMHIDVLLIRQRNGVKVFAGDRYFDVAGREMTGILMPEYDSTWFNAGYQMGLLLHLDIPYCVALGLTLSGMSMRSAAVPDAKQVLAYLSGWMTDLLPETEFTFINE
jgi:hypothetical protein